MNPLDLIEREFLFGSVVKLRGASRLVPGDPRGDFQRAAVEAQYRLAAVGSLRG